MPAPDVGDSSEEASPAPGVDGLVRHYTRADVTLTPGIERMDALARQIKAQNGASKLRAETIAALRAAYLASDWHRILAVHLDAIRRAKTEDEQDALRARLHTVAIATCGQPVRTFDDLIVRAAIVARWYSDEIGNPTRPEDDMIAAVVRGVLDLAGLKFDVEGRLLGATSALPNAGWDGLNSLD
jgi:hypothetical protein